ncbi:MAG: hypothetical protein ACJAT7_000750 [Psychromonas sp.]|jgi:hypothetical protein|uniref:hypothetical protein n=1 Tax=Psychromonas sp. TaxID=1884585 RepID=UPI0039E35FE1
MRDYIETLTLRDFATEELFFEAIYDRLKRDIAGKREKEEQVVKVDIYIDDRHHEYHLIYH